MTKKLSIITINYNNSVGLRRTIESVCTQNYKDFEYIVIDGGSNDGSIDIIKEYENIIDYWVSEPDKGIYNAMNKGVKNAKGEYCLFLNSGDYLYNKDSLDLFQEDKSKFDIISGYVYRADDKGKLIKIRKVYENISMAEIIKKSLPHPSTFIKRKLLVLNPYDENFRICSDWKFFLEELLIKNASFKVLPGVISVFELGGISSRDVELHTRERSVILNNLFNFYPREKEFIDNTDLDFFYLSNMFKKYDGFKKMIINIDYFLLKIYRLFR